MTTPKKYLQLSAALFAIYLGSLPLVILAIDHWLSIGIKSPHLIAAYVLYASAYFWSNQLLDLLNAFGKVPLSAATNFAGTCACAVGVGVSAAAGGDLFAVVSSYAASMVAQVLLAVWLLRPTFASASRQPDHPDPRNRELLRTGVKLMGLNVGQVLTYRADTVLLGALSSERAVGVYAVATTCAGLLVLPANAAGQVLLHDAATGRLDVRLGLKRLLQLELLLGIVAAFGWYVADFAIPFIFGGAFAPAVGVFRVLLVAYLALAPFLILSRVLVGLGSTWAASIPGVLGATALISLGIALIPAYAEYGAAWASVFAYALMSAVAFVFILLYGRKLGSVPPMQ